MTPAHHVLGAVVEMIHTATLVHDDVLDGATVRRHVATVNAGWGDQNSILLGDYLFTHAFHLASTLDDAAPAGSSARRPTGSAKANCARGERGNLELTEEDLFRHHRRQDGRIAGLLLPAGALFSGAAPEVVKAWRIGRYVGLAFQIADDLLDLVGEERTTGKSLGTDLEQQKLTLPLIRLLQQGPTGAGGGRVRQILLGPDDCPARVTAAVPAGERRIGVRPAEGGGAGREGAEGIGVPTAVGVPDDPGGGHGSRGASSH